MFPIRIDIGSVTLAGELNETEAGGRLAEALPLTAEFRVWGDELHFDAPIDATAARRPDSRVHVGDLALWASGSEICIFFGPTPASPAEDPVSAVPVTVVGRVEGAELLRTAKEAASITLAAASTDERGRR